MKPSKALLTGLTTLAIGIVLIICNSLITSAGIVTVAGLLFLVIGVINLILYVTQKDEEGKKRTRGMALVLGWSVSISSIILGLCMLIFNDTFKEMIPLIFALLVFFGAAMSTLGLWFIVRKVTKLPAAVWVLPGIMLVMAIIVAVQDADSDDHIIMILTGVSLILFAIQSFVLSTVTAKANRRAARETSSRPDSSNNANTAAIEAQKVKELKSLDD